MARRMTNIRFDKNNLYKGDSVKDKSFTQQIVLVLKYNAPKVAIVIKRRQSARMEDKMKTLLVALNSKYIHSNLAIHYLRAYAKDDKDNIKLAEYTINQSVQDILKSIFREKADLVAFSCYIWNITMIKEIIKELKKVQPEVKIWAGGPEVSYDAKDFLRNNPMVDGIMVGEGEETFKEMMRYFNKEELELADIKCIAFRSPNYSEQNPEIIITPSRQQLDMNKIPFPYDNVEKFRNKIIYYESSRGCPFSCSYCLSSIDKGIRLRDVELVKKELKIFLDHQVAQVKFVDRTFNCNKKHAMAIWEFIKENDNGITNFHFEISADIISEEELALLSTLRAGQVQFEIGVQSTHPATIDAIHRQMDFDKLSFVVKTIRKSENIHIHLDLIAGLPKETFEIFSKSFNDVYLLRPEQLQLGFLKLLKGSKMELESKEHGIVTTDIPPYEVLFTNWVNYEDILRLKAIEEMVEIYYNTGQFNFSIIYLEHFFKSPIELYSSLSRYYEEKELDLVSHSRLRRYDILRNFFVDVVTKEKGLPGEYYDVFEELLLFDLYLREKLKSRPEFIIRQRDYRQIHREFYKETGFERANTHLEYFDYDLTASSAKGQPIKGKSKIIFDYLDRNPLNKAAKVQVIPITEE